MTSTAAAPTSTGYYDHEARQLFLAAQTRVFVQTDRLFAVLLALQWLAGILAATTISPLAWVGTTSEMHVHVSAALFLGGAIAALPTGLVLTLPGRTITRHVVAIGQMLASALLIHLSGGRIETHFHIFGSLAFLAFYRDWRVLMTATVVVAIDHFWRGIYWPQSVFGVLTASPWRVVEHAAWVIFEDVFLFRSCLQGVSEMHAVADRQARLQETNRSIVAAIGNIQAAAEALAARSSELTEVAEQLTADAGQQSTHMHRAQSFVEKTAISVARNAQHAQSTNQAARQSADQTVDGGQAVADTVTGIQQIAEKIKLIQQIAQTTDILALNAEVQAARVGEHGRGFAVVALEVRKLAEVSKHAAQQISDLTTEALSVAQRAGAVLKEIVPHIGETAELMQQIAAASLDQDTNLQEMKAVMEQLNSSSRRAAEMSHTLSSTALDLARRAHQLQGAIASFGGDGR